MNMLPSTGKPRWSDGSEAVLMDWLTKRENFDRYNAYLKSNKRNLQGPLLMEIEEEMRSKGKNRTMNQISQHLNKMLKKYRETVEFMQAERINGHSISLEELNKRFEYYERLARLDPNEDAFIMHPKKQSKAPAVPFNMRPFGSTSPTLSSRIESTDASPAYTHSYRTSHPYPTSRPQPNFYRSVTSTVAASPTEGYSISRLTKELPIHRISPSTSPYPISYRHHDGAPSSPNPLLPGFRPVSNYSEHPPTLTHRRTSCASVSSSGDELERPLGYPSQPPHLRPHVFMPSSTVFRHEEETDSLSLPHSASSQTIGHMTSYLSTPPLSSDLQGSSTESLSVASAVSQVISPHSDSSPHLKRSYESLEPLDEPTPQSSPAKRPSIDKSSLPTESFKNAAEYLEILKLESQKAAAEAEIKKAETEALVARAKLVETLTAAGCSKEEIIQVVQKPLTQ